MIPQGQRNTRKRPTWRTIAIAISRVPTLIWASMWYPVAAIAGHAQRARADELQRTLDRQRADAAWDNERQLGQIAILQEQLKAYIDISNRERARVAAETAIQARRERDAQHSVRGVEQ